MNATFSWMYSIVPIQSPERWKLHFRAFQFQNFLVEHAHRKKGNNTGALCWYSQLLYSNLRPTSIIIETPGFLKLTSLNKIFNTIILLPHFYTEHCQNLHPYQGFWSRRIPCIRRFVEKLYFLFNTRDPKNPIFLAQQWSQ